jgi:hypothetical protein
MTTIRLGEVTITSIVEDQAGRLFDPLGFFPG